MSLKYVTKKLEDQSLEEEERLFASQKVRGITVYFIISLASFSSIRHFVFSNNGITK